MNVLLKVLGIAAVFLIGIATGVGIYHIQRLDREYTAAKTRWMTCTMAHQTALHGRAKLYRKKMGRWPTDVKELVETNFLPEFSEVHFCPSQFPGASRTYYENDTFVDQTREGVVSHYTASPYRFRVEGDVLKVVCGFDNQH